MIFAGVCCFDSRLFTFHSEHYSLFSCKGKVKRRMTGRAFHNLAFSEFLDEFEG